MQLTKNITKEIPRLFWKLGFDLGPIDRLWADFITWAFFLYPLQGRDKKLSASSSLDKFDIKGLALEMGF